jgi:hypothetical protein
VLATADIARIKSGALADYEIELHDEVLEEVGSIAQLHDYPRYSASVWDLVARGIAAALSEGKEELPARPLPPDVTVHKSSDGRAYVRMSEIPEPTQTLFRQNMSHSSRPYVEDDSTPRDCEYVHDWSDFLAGGR